MTYTLALDLKRPPMTSNDMRRAHWTAVRAAKQHVETLVGWHVKKAHVPLVEYCDVEVVWFAPNGIKRDADSLGPFLKASLDGLVKAGAIPDDSRQFVRKTSSWVDIDRVFPRIEVRIIEVGKDAA